MSDTWRENAIVEAILIIADKKIAQANFDKTIKAIVNKVLDETMGKYLIKYQDSLFLAYATSSKLSYQKDQMVSVLIPGNDWDRVKTILGVVENNVITYHSIPVASDQYNAIGMSGTELSELIGLCSYIDESYGFINGENGFFINEESYKYIQKGNSLALRMDIRTDLASSQVGGNYGVIFRLVFKDNVTGNLTIRNFTVEKKHVIGQPYNLKAITPVEVLYTDVDTLNFLRIDSILAFCEGFPLDLSKSNIKDIYISGIYINGADALTEEALTGYSLHINNPEGTELNDSLNIIKLVAQLKLSGRVVTDNVQYFWGLEDATIFRGSTGKYSGYLGDGWKCLNYYDEGLRAFIPFNSPDFYFTSLKILEDSVQLNIALADSRLSNIKCVAVLSGNVFSGLIQVINTLLGKVEIISSDKTEDEKNKTIYYLDNGNPDLTCLIYDKDNNLIKDNLTYQWSIFPSIGKGELVLNSNSLDVGDLYIEYENTWNEIKDQYDRIADSQKADYERTQEYIDAKNNFDKVLYLQYVYENKYYNFPIKDISGSTKISCAVYQEGVYKGTGSITLYNKTVLEGMYSLNIENGAQVFQYDTKGNSPASKQLEKPLNILPLTFTLIDNQGKIITHDQIKQDGWIKWIIPKTQTLLSSINNGDSINGDLDITVLRADLPLAAGLWDVYKNNDSFTFAIDDRYDSKKNLNYIWLNVKYKDLVLDAYTNFSFPKDGDPGTNGTDIVAKIVTNPITDWVYISNQANEIMFGDDGSPIDSLNFLLYNNSKKISDTANYWICPPATKTGNSVDKRSSYTTYLQAKDNNWQNPIIRHSYINKTIENIQTDKPINIIRGQYRTGSESGDLKYFSEIPICTLFVKSGNYRIKIRSKTGFKYVVYSEDGTRPDYDNTLPFEVFLLEKEGLFYIKNINNYTYQWKLIGNLEFDERQNQLNGINITSEGETLSSKVYIKPKDNFSGLDLSSAIVVQIGNIGFIHIPIYMILNRYGHAALNGWDGNSIELNANGDTILAPQIGAGKKLNDNTFTGVLMGNIKNNSGITDTGLVGYHHGQRSIFLDSDTGKAEFGKLGSGKIIIDPSQKINDLDKALIYSSDYPLDYFLQNPDVKEVGLQYKEDRQDKGMIIDLSTPQIGFGNGNFTVNKDGHLIARGGGEIAGWSITDTKLHKDGKVGMASYSLTVPTDINLKNNNYENDTVAFWAGGLLNLSGANEGKLKDANFYTTHGGYLYSKLGRIAKWNIDENKLLHIDEKVGLGNSDNPKIFHYTNSSGTSSTVSISNSRFWAINNEKLFIVDNNGKIWANEGQIGPWVLNQKQLTNGNTGLGSNIITQADINNAFGENSVSNNVQARIWASTGGTNSSVNFVVSNDGRLYSKAGKIGGWNIEKDKLWSINKNSGNGIRINANGSMSGGQGNGSGSGWAINADGTSSFYGINAHTGYIGGCTITAEGISTTNWHIYPNGLAQFSNIRVTDGYITLGNTTITGSISPTGSTSNSFRSGGLSTGSTGKSSIASGLTGTTGGSFGGTDTLQDFSEKSTAARFVQWNNIGARTISVGTFTASGVDISSGGDNTYITNSGFWLKQGSLNLSNGVGINVEGGFGVSGTMTFSDGSSIRVSHGIITRVSPGSDARWG